MCYRQVNTLIAYNVVCVHGRFSRKILWLHLTQTNHNSEVIVHFYVECVKNLGGEIYLYPIVYAN